MARQRRSGNLAKYLRLLHLMDHGAVDALVLLRQTGEGEIPPWAKKALEPFGMKTVRCIAPPVLAKASSYSDWVGLQLFDGSGSVWPGVTRGLMFLAFVASTSRPRSPVG